MFAECSMVFDSEKGVNMFPRCSIFLVLTMYGCYLKPEEHLMKTNQARSERVDLRMTPAAKRTLQRAASVANKTLTEFLLDTGLNAAADTLADRRVFQLDKKQWDAFMAALSAPPRDNARLRKLLARRPAWER